MRGLKLYVNLFKLVRDRTKSKDFFDLYSLIRLMTL